jgi:hypothetical protein
MPYVVSDDTERSCRVGGHIIDRVRESASAVYEIEVEGQLDQGWSDWLSDLEVTIGDNTTTLAGPVTDQPALRGLLCKVWDMNLTLISVRRIDRA